MYDIIIICNQLPCAGYSLDDHCSETVDVDSYSTSYYDISSRSQYNSLCRVDFDGLYYGKIKLTITGSSLDSSKCQVSVGSGNNIERLAYFSQTTTSDNTGYLTLFVQGSECDTFDLVFTVHRVISPNYCTGFTCVSGECVLESDVCDDFDDCSDGSDEFGCFYWSTGGYAGVAIGSIVFVLIIAAISTALYRRNRVVVVRSPAIIGSGQGFVTQSRW